MDTNNLSDEEFMNQFSNMVDKQPEETDPEPKEQTQTTEQQETNESEEELHEPEQTESIESTESEENSDQQYVENAEEPEGNDSTSQRNVESKAPEVDYKKLYEEVMTPFKANGKNISLNNVEEVKQLMQMGANYTKKMQEIAPYRKLLTMLENNDLLDENKINFLIDIQKKNPHAIGKLIKDSEIDPLEIDTDAASTYQPTNYSVSEEEIAFKTVLEDLSATPQGRNTITTINTEWDAKSKEQLWQYPQMMAIINAQMENGIYEQISAEVDRARLLGRLPPNMSFLDAYTTIGNELQSRAGGNTQTNAPVARQVAKPKQQVVNNQSARAASTPKGSTSKAPVINPLQMSDDEFMAQFEKFRNRV